MDERKRPAQPEGGRGENDDDDQSSSNASSSDTDGRLNRKVRVAAASHAAAGAVVTSSSKARSSKSSEEKATGSDDGGGQEARAKKRMRTSEATSQDHKVSHEQVSADEPSTLSLAVAHHLLAIAQPFLPFYDSAGMRCLSGCRPTGQNTVRKQQGNK